MIAGCSGFIQKRAAESTYAILEKSQIAARRQPDLELARAAMPGGLIQLEAFSLTYPDERGFKTLYAEAICQYATGFVFDDWEDATLGKRDDETQRIATRLQGLVAQCIAANRALLHEQDLAKTTDADALRWIATSEAVLLALAPLANLPKLPAITAELERVITLAPGAHDGDAELMLGTLQAGRSQFLGGPDGSKYFAAIRKPGVLIVDVLFARSVAVAHKDRALFTQTLERVLATDVTAWPERRLSNEIARVKAKRYLAAIDQLIPN